MVGKDRYGGFFSSLRSTELIAINDALHRDPVPVLEDDEYAADLTPPELLDYIKEAIEGTEADLREELYWISPQSKIDAREDGYPEVSKERELRFRLQAAEAMGEARRDLIVLNNAKKKLENYIKRWYQ